MQLGVDAGVGLGLGDVDRDLRWVSMRLLNLVLMTKVCGGVFGSSCLWWGVLASCLDLDGPLCGDLGDVDVLGGDLDLDVDGSLGVGEDGSLDEGVVCLGLGLGVDVVGVLAAGLDLVAHNSG